MKEHFRTTDLWLAAYLLATGANLAGLETDELNPSRYIFILAGEGLQGKVRTFSENGKVPALSFKQIVLDLKHQLYQKMRGKKNEKDFSTLGH